MGRLGLRERKKQKTRLALIDAALSLFLEQGYEATTVDQIAAAVDVSPRTFFRYFATKEAVALSLPADGQEIVLAELTARPDDESPFTALSHAARAVVTMLEKGDLDDTARFLRAREVIDGTPALFAGSVRQMMENEQRLIAEIARRQEASPDDLLPHFVVALFTTVTRVGFELCDPADINNITALSARLETTLALAERSLRPGWDRPGHPAG
ncbi:TetR family transcriptional regulator [Streptosporangium sp. NBC_01755]|uniref:TetR family transcriptional regulator n=1 Tax=unclassified Streptosporangium TaxID=2632669 RepID=UPI002DD91452|nr:MULTISPECIES: TetR family transcriptional regulator [unclassified Streptosporangium]WSA23882.1 TetR family transcriptional regulator [Streptosporangium sp. NBC_01810]WSC98043.1 TetR family transcriptional regulator [Streptosporangium sp. NBC_01755]